MEVIVNKEGGSPGGSSPSNIPPEGGSHQSNGSPSNPSSQGLSDEEAALDAIRKERDRLLSEVTSLRTERRDLRGTPSSEAQAGSDTRQQPTKDPVSVAAERRALRIFTEKHPEYADPQKWNRLQDTYVSRRGNIIWEDILEDYEDAHYLMNREEFVRSEAQKRATEVATRVLEGDRADIGGTSSNPPADSTPKEQLTEEEMKIFNGLRQADPTLTEEKFIQRKKRLQK